MLSRLRWNKVLRDAWRHKARSAGRWWASTCPPSLSMEGWRCSLRCRWVCWAVVVIVSGVASFWPARRASGISVREALAYE